MLDQSIWKIFSILLVVILLYVIPIMHTFERQDDITYSVVYTETHKFIDSVRDLGYMTDTMYNELKKKISATGNLYQIELEHYKKQYVPVYDDKTHQFLEEYTIVYDGTYTENIEEVLSSSGSYSMDIGDFVYIEVKNQGKTKAAVIRDYLYVNQTTHPTIFVRGGGMVRNENH